jgi:hypothetical protein
VIYEINTAVWLTELSEAAGRRLTLADVSAAAWDDVTPAGVDAVWLMGVWERSPAGLALAMANPELPASFREALPDLTSSDVIGSPYCVRNYVVDAAFGGPTPWPQLAPRSATEGCGCSLTTYPTMSPRITRG